VSWPVRLNGDNEYQYVRNHGNRIIFRKLCPPPPPRDGRISPDAMCRENINRGEEKNRRKKRKIVRKLKLKG
jgi:hypothetical protein